MAKKIKTSKKIKKNKMSSGKKSSKLMDIVIGAILGNVVSKYVSAMPVVKDLPYPKILSPVAIGLGASYLKIPYSEGMVVGASVGAVTEAIKSFAPESISKLMGADEYVISGNEGSDPLMGAQFLLGENDTQNQNPLDRDDYVISGASNDPLD